MCEQRGLNATVREAEPEDTPLWSKLLPKSTMKLSSWGSRMSDCLGPITPKHFFARCVALAMELILSALSSGEIVGYLDVTAPRFTSCRGAVFIGSAGLLTTHRGLGIGAKLFVAAEEWATAREAWRLELRCDTTNRQGLALFRKRGFQIEGRVTRAFRVGDTWRDHYWMAKLLGVFRVPAPKISSSVPPLTIPELVTVHYPGSGWTISNAWRCKARSSASAAVNSASVSTSGGFRMLGGSQLTRRSVATKSRFAAAWANAWGISYVLPAS